MLSQLFLQCLQNLVRTYNMRRRLLGILLGLALALCGHSIRSLSIPILYLGGLDGARNARRGRFINSKFSKYSRTGSATHPTLSIAWRVTALLPASEGRRIDS